MKAVEYLENELKAIAAKFPNVNIRYGYNKMIKTHIVELLPLIEYNTNEELDMAWIPLSVSFLEKYMNEEIAFISSDSSLSLKEVIFEFNRDACREENIISEIFEPITNQLKIYSYSFPTYMQNGVIENSIVILGKLLDKPVDDVHEENATNYSYSQAA